MARDLKISHTMLSQILNGKKKLSFERAAGLVQLLKVDETTERRYLRAAAIDAAGESSFKTYLQDALAATGDTEDEKDSFYLLELDRFKFLSEWYHVAVLDLTTVEGFKPSFDWIAAELSISRHQAETAVTRLQRLGLLEMRDGRWIKTKAKIAVPTSHPEKAVQEFHDQMIEKAREALKSSDARDFAARDITGTTMAIDPTRIPEAKKRIEAFRRQLFEFMSGGRCTELYQLNVQLFRLTKGKKRHV